MSDEVVRFGFRDKIARINYEGEFEISRETDLGSEWIPLGADMSLLFPMNTDVGALRALHALLSVGAVFDEISFNMGKELFLAAIGLPGMQELGFRAYPVL